MYYKQFILILLVMLAGSSALAQEDNDEQPKPCTVKPVFHCVQSLDDGTVIGHFGYTASCTDKKGQKTEIYIDIGEDNFFSPGNKDRGQSKIFWPGRNAAVFEIELSSEEVKKGIKPVWNVKGNTASVDYSKKNDGAVDCDKLP